MQAVSLISVGIGGFLGACARWLLGVWLAGRTGALPAGTLAANFLGSLLLALFLGRASREVGLAPELRLLVSVGFFGAFTTFSTFAWESLGLARDGQLLTALGYILITNLVCLLGALLGLTFASRL